MSSIPNLVTITVSNLRYADDTTLMEESEEELKNFLMRVKVESSKKWSEAQHQKN